MGSLYPGGQNLSSRSGFFARSYIFLVVKIPYLLSGQEISKYDQQAGRGRSLNYGGCGEAL